jgi:arylformamidase
MPQGSAVREPFHAQEVRIKSDHNPSGDILVTNIRTVTHIGTHIDAPSHILGEHAKDISDYPLETFVGPCRIVNTPCVAFEKIGLTKLVGDLGDLAPGSVVLVRTGWGRFFRGREYENVAAHPWFGADVAEWLIKKQVKMFGTDTISPDAPPEVRPPGYRMDMHVNLLSADIPVVENLYLEEVPSVTGTFYGFPLNFEGCDGAPARAVIETTAASAASRHKLAYTIPG